MPAPQVIITLPGASQQDAEAFGLWLESVLRAAREDGDLDTIIGTIAIAVPPAFNFTATVRGGAGGAGGGGGRAGYPGSAEGQGGAGGGGAYQ